MLAKPQTFMNASGESVSILIPKQPSLLVVPSFFLPFSFDKSSYTGGAVGLIFQDTT